MQPPAGSQVSRVPAQRPPSDQLGPPPPTSAPDPPRRRVRTILTVTAAMLTALFLSGLAAGYLLYDRATAPDRSAPDVVVDNYLRAFLVDRNDIRATLYICSEEPVDLAALTALRAEVEQREASFGVDVRVSWGPLNRSENQRGESVATTLSISSSANGQPRSSRREDWIFDVVRNEKDWRVCGGRKVS
ncbi:hypothetical protein QTQ03_17315 [Micromonospora sp. WMMA1363]|uniref:hypothetical protein n=1 Tax=Micromonospora sp. WMMA1363 TaxID=3053985 RepID=UPI00259CD298|nr:hypothetical protein [Micromonospora sp. WMMA1363]MDM4721277.1 hypothetical protein [Micromonospora sp. WMMA1363]